MAGVASYIDEVSCITGRMRHSDPNTAYLDLFGLLINLSYPSSVVGVYIYRVRFK